MNLGCWITILRFGVHTTEIRKKVLLVTMNTICSVLVYLQIQIIIRGLGTVCCDF